MVWFAIYSDPIVDVNNIDVRSVCHCDVGYLEYLIDLYEGSGNHKLKSRGVTHGQPTPHPNMYSFCMWCSKTTIDYIYSNIKLTAIHIVDRLRHRDKTDAMQALRDVYPAYKKLMRAIQCNPFGPIYLRPDDEREVILQIDSMIIELTQREMKTHMDGTAIQCAYLLDFLCNTPMHHALINTEARNVLYNVQSIFNYPFEPNSRNHVLRRILPVDGKFLHLSLSTEHDEPFDTYARMFSEHLYNRVVGIFKDTADPNTDY